MDHIFLLDTSVWLDAAADPFGDEILTAIEKLLDLRQLKLLKPEIISTEFDRNKGDYAKRLRKSISERAKDMRRLAKEYASPEQQKAIADALDPFVGTLDRIESAAQMRLQRIERLLTRADAIVATATVKDKAGQRAIHKKAPFHTEKNSYDDALIIETFAEEAAKDLRSTFTFVTSNTTDFCNPQNHKQPHPDLASCFGGNTRFSINIAEALNSLLQNLPEEEARKQELISQEVVRHVEWVVEQRDKCPICGSGVLGDCGWVRGPKGVQWHLQCSNCGRMFPTNDYPDD